MPMNDNKIYAIDFDGTLCVNEWPEIGKPKQEIIDKVIKLREQGHELILWTCRSGELLKDAVNWCNERGLFFHAVNDNIPRLINEYGNNCRKIFADFYLDDKNILLNEFLGGDLT